MSDVITGIGKYTEDITGKAARIVHVEDGYAFGFNSDGSPDHWVCADGRGYASYSVIGPWPKPIPAPLPKPNVDVGEGWRMLRMLEKIEQSDEVMCNGIGGSKRWSVICTGCDLVGKTVAQGASWWSESFKPVFYRRRVEQPFRISDHGPGVYETRNGQEESVIEQFPYGESSVTWGSGDGHFAQWWDDGYRISGREQPGDLVCYLRPLPTEAPQPEEWTPTSFLKEVEQEAKRAVSLHGEFNSLHEAYAVILEEVDELWDEVRKQSAHRVELDVYNELVQIAASCVKAAQILKHGTPKEML